MIEALPFEVAFWGDCLDTFEEERKQKVYARLMGIYLPTMGADVLDIGGGPVSVLLKCPHRGRNCIVSDPILSEVPPWVRDRYRQAGIQAWKIAGEELDPIAPWVEEVWIYNVLQHVVDPELVISNARRAGPLVRIFEWIDMAPCEGHPNELTTEMLDNAFRGSSSSSRFIHELDSEGCYGRAYVGIYEQKGVTP